MKGLDSKYEPEVGERCLISGPNCDDGNGCIFAKFKILWKNDIFVLYGNDGYYPNLQKWEHIIAKKIQQSNPQDVI